MAETEGYRWERRRRRIERRAFHLTTFYFVGIILLFALFFISLRLFFTFEVISSPCAELLATIGSGQGLPSIMTMNYFIAIIFGVFWICVALNASMISKLSTARIIWFLTIFIAIVFLGLFNRALVSEADVNTPDGTLNVAVNQDGIRHPIWESYEEGVWYAWGRSSCIWLNENKVVDDINMNARHRLTLLERLGLGRPYVDILIDNQVYRPLTSYERDRFLKKQACQSDLTLYGKPASACERKYLYPVEPGLSPPDHEIEYLAPELLILKAEQPVRSK